MAPRQGEAGDKGSQGQDRGERDHGPAAGIDGLQLEAEAGVPEEMPDAVGQVKVEGEGPAEKQDAAKPGADEGLGARKRLRTACGGDQPINRRMVPIARATPVIRCRIESTEVSWGL